MSTTAVLPVAFVSGVSDSPAKDTPMRTPFSAVRTLILAFLVLAGSLGAVFASPTRDAAASTTYGFWQQDGCYYTWSGPTHGFQRTTTCGSAQGVAWGKENGVDVLSVYDGTTWRPQAVFMPATRESPQGTLAVIFTDGHVFFYQYHAGYWLHSARDANGVPYVETAGGWVNTQSAQSAQSAQSQQLYLEAQEYGRAANMRMIDALLAPPCTSSYNGCD